MKAFLIIFRKYTCFLQDAGSIDSKSFLGGNRDIEGQKFESSGKILRFKKFQALLSDEFDFK